METQKDFGGQMAKCFIREVAFGFVSPKKEVEGREDGFQKKMPGDKA